MRRPSVEDFVTDISTRMIGLPLEEVDRALDAALRAVGAFTGCDRVYLFAVDDEMMHNTHEWCAPGVRPRIDRLRAVATSELPWMLGRLRRGEFVRVDRVDDVHDMSAAERAHLEAQDIASLALAPIQAGGRLVGFIGADAVGRAVPWSGQVATILRWLGDVVGGVLARRDSHEALRPILGPDGDVVEIQAVGREITGRRAAETALRESEERFRGAFEEAPIGMGIATLDGRFLRVNRALCELFGYTEADLLAGTVAAVTYPGDETHGSHLERLASGEASSVCFENRYVTADGRAVWALVTLSLLGDSSGEPGHVLGHMVDITERKAAEDRLAQHGLHDLLTGLPNRVLLLDRLEQALARRQRTGSGVAVLFCNLDHFKIVKDSLGHVGGDELLVKVAQRLRGEARAAETVACFGADEFVLVTEGIRRQEDVMTFARRLGRALEVPFSICGSEVVTSMSIGVAFTAPAADAGSVTADGLVRDASAAMARAKNLGGGRFVICDDVTRATTAGQLDLLNALRGAVARGELRLHYQPIVRTGDREAIGVEALVRWNHPTRGLLGPGDFLPLAEQTGLVAQIGEWVLEQACRQAAEWRRGDDTPPFQVWVNLSAVEVARPNLAELVASALRTSGADPRQLCLELTEHAVMADPEQTVATLTSLRTLGVRVAIDDFGTGYSSMASLSRLPLDSLKVDRSFVTGLGRRAEDFAITRAIIDLAHGLGLEVVAEGVEDEQQLTELLSLGCDFVQGFLLAHPQPATDLERRLRSSDESLP